MISRRITSLKDIHRPTLECQKQLMQKWYLKISQCDGPFTWTWSENALIVVLGGGHKLLAPPSIKHLLVRQCGESFVEHQFEFRDGIMEGGKIGIEVFTKNIKDGSLKRYYKPLGFNGQQVDSMVRELIRECSMKAELFFYYKTYHLVHFCAKTIMILSKRRPKNAELYAICVKTFYYRIVAARQEEKVFKSINYYRAAVTFHKQNSATTVNVEELAQLAVYYEAFAEMKQYFNSRLQKMKLSVDLESNVYTFYHDNWGFMMKGNRKLRKCPDGKIKEKLRTLKTKRCVFCKYIIWEKRGKKANSTKVKKNRRCRNCNSYYCSKYCQKRAWKYCMDGCKKDKND